ncbi:hypothetical protein CEP51_014107 [Fusarium floridanum]|uniref:Uncharacterized protein n=1 Tax=Fusarium floridanum TaxID=1325733 RepID=A0A428PZ58_9HYPO|nr:hypothetical protein CEP51_014107 [Fusarium floridanum]
MSPAGQNSQINPSPRIHHQYHDAKRQSIHPHTRQNEHETKNKISPTSGSRVQPAANPFLESSNTAINKLISFPSTVQGCNDETLPR